MLLPEGCGGISCSVCSVGKTSEPGAMVPPYLHFCWGDMSWDQCFREAELALCYFFGLQTKLNFAEVVGNRAHGRRLELGLGFF